MNSFQIALSTAEEEVNYFTGPQMDAAPQSTATILPPGVYRVVNDTLYLVVQEASPGLP